MPVVPCPEADCGYMTPDLDTPIAAILLSHHLSTIHTAMPHPPVNNISNLDRNKGNGIVSTIPPTGTGTTANEMMSPDQDHINQHRQRVLDKIRPGISNENQANEFKRELESYLLTPSVNVNSTWADGNNTSSLLFYAIDANNEKAVEILLKNGANSNMKDKQESAALHKTAKMGSVSMTSQLVRHGAVIDVTNKFLNTPLLVAVRFSKLEVARELLEKGANVNYRMKSGWSPLHAAISESNEEMVRLLCDFKADQTSPATSRKIDPTGGKMTPKEVAQIKGLNGMLAILENKTQREPNPSGSEGIKGKWTTEAEDILVKIRKGEHTLDHLIKAINGAKIDINASHIWRDVRYNLLFHAIEWKRLEAVKNILTFQPDVNWRNDRGSSALQLAVKSGDDDIVVALLTHGARVDNSNNLGMSALHVATKNNLVSIAALLISNGADVNVRMMSGWTPLHNAVLADNQDMVELLIKNGADKSIGATNRSIYPNGRRVSPKELADRRGQQTIIALLR